MDRKKIIQIVVIIIAFGGSGFVLYNGLHKPSGSSPISAIPIDMGLIPGADNSSAQPTIGSVLPNGNTLEFDVLERQKLEFGIITFPELNASKDLDVPVPQLIRSLASTTAP